MVEAADRRPSNPAEQEVVTKRARLAPEHDIRWSFYVEATTRETLARLRLRPADRVLDVGRGTGALLRRLAESHTAALPSGVDRGTILLAVERIKSDPGFFPGATACLLGSGDDPRSTFSCSVPSYGDGQPRA